MTYCIFNPSSLTSKILVNLLSALPFLKICSPGWSLSYSNSVSSESGSSRRTGRTSPPPNRKGYAGCRDQRLSLFDSDLRTLNPPVSPLLSRGNPVRKRAWGVAGRPHEGTGHGPCMEMGNGGWAAAPSARAAPEPRALARPLIPAPWDGKSPGSQVA